MAWPLGLRSKTHPEEGPRRRVVQKARCGAFLGDPFRQWLPRLIRLRSDSHPATAVGHGAHGGTFADAPPGFCLPRSAAVFMMTLDRAEAPDILRGFAALA